jgi:DNA-directed RNA polymerase subunit L/DNA-directed RNA polymerase alpha subunit
MTKYKVKFNDIDISIVNGLRRVLLTDIEIPGFIGEALHDEIDDTIDIKVNTGALHNEIIKNRICQIPICFSEEDIKTFKQDDYSFELKVENKSDEILNVTTNDIKVKHHGTLLTEKQTIKLFPSNEISKDFILITRLRKNEKLAFNAQAKIKSARYHAGFCPVSGATYHFESKDTKSSDVLTRERNYEKNSFGEPKTIVLRYESINKLSGEYLLNCAYNIIIEKLNSINKALVDNKDNKILDFKAYNEDMTTYEFVFAEEDDTIGNIIQSYIHNVCIRDKKEYQNDKYCTYIGYVCIHPLQNTMNLRITLPSANKPEEFKEFLYQMNGTLIKNLTDMKDTNKIEIE